MLHPSRLCYEQDLVRLVPILRELVAGLPERYPIGFTSTMHGLVALDAEGLPLSNALAWSDLRAADQAARLREHDPEAAARTGTPIHPMAWPAKLLWIKEQRRSWWGATERVLDVKTYLLEQMTGRTLAMDISSASGTGLWNQEEQKWDESLCSLLELPLSALPAVRGPRDFISWQGRTLFPGAGDGPLGNLGTGAVKPGRVAINLGPSGAVRTFTRDRRPLSPALFRYHLDWDSWVEGGAISNGSSVLDWLRSKRSFSAPELFGMVEQSSPGARGIRVYPYFQGERAPFWRAGVESHVEGFEAHHTFADLVRATLEGMAFCLNRLLDELPPPQEPIRCTGFMFSSPVWCQLLADVTGFPLSVSPLTQATALGAALLTRPDYLERAAEIEAGLVVEPDEEAHLRYQVIYPLWAAGDPNLTAR